MKKRSRAEARIIAAIGLTLGFDTSAYAQAQSSVPDPAQKGTAAMAHASGTFEVKLKPQAPDDKAEGSTLGRLSIDKQFKGDLEGTGKGEMLTAATDVKGSAAYVAIERVTGTLHGRSGSFVLVHRGIMTSSTQHLDLAVVPDSGSGQLVGLSGKMTIKIDGGKHSYELEYSLPEAPR
jgi:hypothetical protein